LGVVGYFLWVKKSLPIAQQTSTPTPTLTKTSTLKGRSVDVREIIAHTGKNINQPTPEILFYYANGHFLLHIVPTHLLIYDGSVVYSNADLVDAKLSHNGLHFICNTNSAIYVDGNKVASERNSHLIGVSDSGKDFYYGVFQTPGDVKTMVYKKNEDIISTPPETLEMSVSSKSNSSRMSTDSPCPGLSSKESVFTSNGQSAHICNISQQNGTYINELIINGRPQLQSPNLNNLEFTDQGHYAVSDFTENKVYIDGQAVAVGQYGRAHINEDASHRLIVDGENSTLDGKPIAIKDGLIGVEMTGNTVFLYYLMK